MGEQTLSRRSAQKTWIVIAVCVVTAGVIAAVVYAMNRDSDAQTVAREYVEHVADGEFDAAFDMEAPGGPSGTNASARLDAAADGDTEFIHDIEIGDEAAIDDGGSVVNVSFDVGDERISDSVTISDPRSSKPIRRGLSALMDFGGSRVASFDAQVGEATIPTERSLVMYPGVYTVRREAGTYLDADEARVSVDSKHSETIDLAFTPTPEVDRAIAERVGALIEDCTKNEDDTYNKACKVHPSAPDYRLAPVEWSLIGEPDIGAFDARLNTFEARFTLRAAYRGKETPDGAVTPRTQEIPVAVRSNVAFEDPDTVAFTLWPGRDAE